MDGNEITNREGLLRRSIQTCNQMAVSKAGITSSQQNVNNSNDNYHMTVELQVYGKLTTLGKKYLSKLRRTSLFLFNRIAKL